MSTSHDPKHEIARISMEMAHGCLDLLDGCRTVVQFRARLSEHDMDDPDLMVLVAVESDLDGVPTGVEREHWAPELLRHQEMQKDRYLASTKTELLRACMALATKWAPGC